MTQPPTNNTPAQQAPLEDLMAAMDVVDTLRHQHDIAERELNEEDRRERFLARLKQLYRAQGIDVPEHVLQEGIDALEQERFMYHPVKPSWQTKLAHIWVTRGTWLKPVGFLAVVASMFTSVYVVNDVLPERELRNGLPVKLETSLQGIRNSAKNPQVIEQALNQVQLAKNALKNDELDKAKTLYADIQSVESRLQQRYSIRVISRRNESSGVWRVPDVNESGRNYYLIVEAIDDNNKIVELEILNEETNRKSMAKTWGIRVNEDTFYKIAADKNDDGIIQRNKVGEKPVGYLKPTFSIPTTGGTITKWN